MGGEASYAVDVVILTWNDGELLDAAVGSVLATTGDDVRIVVIDNASDVAVAFDDPRVDVVRNLTNRGVAGGRNDGAAVCSSPYMCFLDSDAELRAGSLDALRAPLDADPSISVAVPVFEDQAPEESAGAAPTVWRKIARMTGKSSTYASTRRAPDAQWWDVDFGIGACQMIRRSAFDRVGGLDEAIFWADDLDFCLRIADAGGRVVQVAGAPVLHPPRRRYSTPFSVRGVHHTLAMLRLLWRHRGRSRRAP